MSFIQADFYSRVLQMECQLNAVLPEARQGVGANAAVREGKYPVLFLLHGTSGDHSDWERWTSIERYAAHKGIAVVMCAGQLSAYANMAYGERFFDYVAYEVPQIAREFFSLSAAREDSFIAGLSMGGYGALKVGLTDPERYGAVGCLSSFNQAYMPPLPDGPLKQIVADRLRLCWDAQDANGIIGTESDLFVLARRALDAGKKLPQIFFACGSDDHNFPPAQDTIRFFTELEGDPFRFKYYRPRGRHDWEFWDEWVQKLLDWLPLQD